MHKGSGDGQLLSKSLRQEKKENKNKKNHSNVTRKTVEQKQGKKACSGSNFF
jgi:hypothetical protein